MFQAANGWLFVKLSFDRVDLARLVGLDFFFLQNSADFMQIFQILLKMYKFIRFHQNLSDFIRFFS